MKERERNEGLTKEYRLAAERLISYFEKKHGRRLENSALELLTERLRTLEAGPAEALAQVMRRCFPEEYDAGQRALEILEELTGNRMEEKLAAAAALALIEAQFGGSMEEMIELVEIIGVANELILTEMGVTPERNAKGYSRYLNHLKRFAQRVVTNYHYNDDVTALMQTFSSSHQREFRCCVRVAEYINRHYHYEVGRDELLYLAAHMAYLTRE